MKPLFEYFVFTNLWVCLISCGLTQQTFFILGASGSVDFYGLLFFATLTSYNFHWSLSDPTLASSTRTLWSVHHKTLLQFLTLLGALGTIFYLPKNLNLAIYVLPAAILTFVYTAPKLPFYPFLYLRNLAIAKTFYLTAVWTYVTTILPLLATGETFSMLHKWFIINRFLLLYAICLLFDFRDKQEDIGIKNFITYASNQTLYVFLAFISVAFALTLYFFYVCDGNFKRLSLIATPFFLLICTLRQTLRTKSPYWYDGFLDGILLLPNALRFTI
jgi:hypothetical protein